LDTVSITKTKFGKGTEIGDNPGGGFPDFARYDEAPLFSREAKPEGGGWPAVDIQPGDLH